MRNELGSIWPLAANPVAVNQTLKRGGNQAGLLTWTIKDKSALYLPCAFRRDVSHLACGTAMQGVAFAVLEARAGTIFVYTAQLTIGAHSCRIHKRSSQARCTTEAS
jgi:hypothetical protein